jgi:hypothetical protein
MMGLPIFPMKGHFDGDWFQLHTRLRLSAKPTAWTDTRGLKLLTLCSHQTKTSSGPKRRPVEHEVPVATFAFGARCRPLASGSSASTREQNRVGNCQSHCTAPKRMRTQMPVQWWRSLSRAVGLHVCLWMSGLLFINSLRSATVGFDQANYGVEAGAVFPVTVRISPNQAGGLYSFGVRLGFPSDRARVVSVGMNDVISELRNDGPRLTSPVVGVGPGFAAAKGTAEFLSGLRPTSQRPELVTFQVQDLGLPGSYELTLDFFNTLGPTEQVFVDGNGGVLDSSIQFQRATVTRVARPELKGDILIIRTGSHPDVETMVSIISNSSLAVKDPQDGLPRPPVIAVGTPADLKTEALLGFQVIIWANITGEMPGMGDAEVDALWHAWQFGSRMYLLGTDPALSAGSLGPVARERWTELTGLQPSDTRVGPGMVVLQEPRDRSSELFLGGLTETALGLVDDFPFNGTTKPGTWIGTGEVRARLAGVPVLIRHPAEDDPGDGRARRLTQDFPVGVGSENPPVEARLLFLNAVTWLLGRDCDSFLIQPVGEVSQPTVEQGPCAPHVLRAVISNNGRCAARGVLVTNLVPEGFTVQATRITSDPPGANGGIVFQRGRETVFAIGRVREDSVVTVEVDVVPSRRGAYQAQFVATALYRSPIHAEVDGVAAHDGCGALRVEIRHGLLGGAEIRIDGDPGGVQSIESSTDLRTWRDEGLVPMGTWMPVGSLIPDPERLEPVFIRVGQQ